MNTLQKKNALELDEHLKSSFFLIHPFDPFYVKKRQ
jgi:hypothetical protein